MMALVAGLMMDVPADLEKSKLAKLVPSLLTSWDTGTYETKPKDDSMTIKCTFFQLGQFMGFLGSCSHATAVDLSICFSLASD